MLSVPGPERKRCPEGPFEPGRLQGLPEPGLQHNNALFPSTPHHHHRALGRLNGAMGRGSRGGGGQAVEEVISPQLAPLPRSLKGRRKPPGPPPRDPVSSAVRPQPSLHGSRYQQWAPSSPSWAHIPPRNWNRLELQSQAQQFPKCLPSFSFPICTMEPRAFTS